MSTLVPRYLLFSQDADAKTLADVGARLARSIEDAGYRQPRHLGAGCNGFAIVLDLERIHADGARLPDAAGFAPPRQGEAFSLAGYLRRLFHAPPGHYRQIVFVVSPQRMAQTTPPPTEGQLRAIARDGVSSLPPSFARVAFGPEYEVIALIYEFEKGPRDGDALLVPPDGRLGATVHLQRARLYREP